MRKTKIFQSVEEWEQWSENCFDSQDVPILIDDGWKIAADMFTECKSWKTALKHFEKAFAGINDDVTDWIETINESCENGCFEDTTGWKPAWTNDPKEIAEIQKGGAYAWGVEEMSDGYWYIYLNISGVYAGKPANRG